MTQRPPGMEIFEFLFPQLPDSFIFKKWEYTGIEKMSMSPDKIMLIQENFDTILNDLLVIY